MFGSLKNISVSKMKQYADDIKSGKVPPPPQSMPTTPQELLEQAPQYKGVAGSDGYLQGPYKVQYKDIPKNWMAPIIGQTGVDPWGKNLAVGDRGDVGKSQLDKMATDAFSVGPSAWAKAAGDAQRLDEQGTLDDVLRREAGRSQSAMSTLASMGGMDSGARENIVRNAMRNSMNAAQETKRSGMRDRLGISMQDEKNKLDMKSQLPGMNLAFDQYENNLNSQNRDYNTNLNMWNLNRADTNSWKKQSRIDAINERNIGNDLNVQQINANNAIGDLARQNQYNQNLYGIKGQVIGSSAVAKKMGSGGGGKGGWNPQQWGKDLGDTFTPGSIPGVGKGGSGTGINFSPVRDMFFNW